MVFSVETIGLFLGLLWLLILTFFYYRLINHYNNLTKDTNKKTLQEILDAILKKQQINEETTSNLLNRCDILEKNNNFCIQKIGLLRFNPFKDTGGDQSFILALLDAKDTGVVISGLYSRSGTRWYAKKVIEGKGFEHDLSEEEKKALQKAKTGVN